MDGRVMVLRVPSTSNTFSHYTGGNASRQPTHTSFYTPSDASPSSRPIPMSPLYAGADAPPPAAYLRAITPRSSNATPRSVRGGRRGRSVSYESPSASAGRAQTSRNNINDNNEYRVSRRDRSGNDSSRMESFLSTNISVDSHDARRRHNNNNNNHHNRSSISPSHSKNQRENARPSRRSRKTSVPRRHGDMVVQQRGGKRIQSASISSSSDYSPHRSSRAPGAVARRGTTPVSHSNKKNHAAPKTKIIRQYSNTLKPAPLISPTAMARVEKARPIRVTARDSDSSTRSSADSPRVEEKRTHKGHSKTKTTATGGVKRGPSPITVPRGTSSSSAAPITAAAGDDGGYARRFSVDETVTVTSVDDGSSNWDVNGKYLQAVRAGPSDWPDHILAKHPDFQQEDDGVSPFLMYYFDETAPNEVLLANDVKGEHPITVAKQKWQNLFKSKDSSPKKSLVVEGDFYGSAADAASFAGRDDPDDVSSVSSYTRGPSYYTESAFTSISPSVARQTLMKQQQQIQAQLQALQAKKIASTTPRKGCCGGGRQVSAATQADSDELFKRTLLATAASPFDATLATGGMNGFHDGGRGAGGYAASLTGEKHKFSRLEKSKYIAFNSTPTHHQGMSPAFGAARLAEAEHRNRQAALPPVYPSPDCASSTVVSYEEPAPRNIKKAKARKETFSDSMVSSQEPQIQAREVAYEKSRAGRATACPHCPHCRGESSKPCIAHASKKKPSLFPCCNGGDNDGDDVASESAATFGPRGISYATYEDESTAYQPEIIRAAMKDLEEESMSVLSFAPGDMRDVSVLSSTAPFTRKSAPKGAENGRDYGYHVRKYFFDASDMRVPAKGTESKMLPQYSVSYQNFPTLCYDVIAPTSCNDFFRAKRAPGFFG